MRYITFRRPVPEHQIDRYQCERHRQISTHVVSIESNNSGISKIIYENDDLMRFHF